MDKDLTNGLINCGKFLLATGEYEVVSAVTQVVPTDIPHKGNYYFNNGIIAFSDTFFGNVYVGIESAETENILLSNGYKRNPNFTVPFSRGYNPASRVEHELNRLRK